MTPDEALLNDVSAKLYTLKWESAKPDGMMTHFTGRGRAWTVQLIVLGDGQRMGSATNPSGFIVVDLTEEVALQAERAARSYFEAQHLGRGT